jgi:small subunit ribosomal protein S2
MASQAHIGHATSLWNPANQRYIYGVRQGLHIISLEATATHLRRAAKVVEGVAYYGGLILFVGTRTGQARCVVNAARMAKGCHLFARWIPGSITNGDQILGGCGMRAVDELDNDVNLRLVDEKLSDHRALKPDLVVCLNPLENYICLHECGLQNIPTIGIIDTDADPTWVTYPIPANDDRQVPFPRHLSDRLTESLSLRCVQLIAGVLGRAGESGQKKRIAAAQTGLVTWETPEFLRNWIKEQTQRDKQMDVA